MNEAFGNLNNTPMANQQSNQNSNGHHISLASLPSAFSDVSHQVASSCREVPRRFTDSGASGNPYRPATAESGNDVGAGDQSCPP